MSGRTSVLRRVAVRRIVATVGAAAFLAGAKVHPCGADFDALLTFPSFGVFDGGNGIDVNATLLGQDTPLRPKHLMHQSDGDRPLADG